MPDHQRHVVANLDHLLAPVLVEHADAIACPVALDALVVVDAETAIGEAGAVESEAVQRTLPDVFQAAIEAFARGELERGAKIAQLAGERE